MQDQVFDHIIVGAGSAGCVLANRLTQDGARSVLLLEAGGSDNYHWIHIPVGYLYCIGNPRTDWGFQTAPVPGLNGRALGYPRGRALGGCSAINGMLYLRGQAADYDGWRQMGLADWGWEDVLPWFLKSEDDADGPSDLHGAGGEWRVDHQRLSWDILDAFAEACVAAGLPRTTDFNTGDNHGVGLFRVNQKNGWRWTTAKGFLRPAKGRPNLSVRTHAQVARIRFDGRRATGVDLTDGTRLSAKEVILSAGAIGSPQIMQLSGVGPGDLLQDMGIDMVHEAPDMGANLQDHLQLRCAYRVTGAKTLNTMANSLLGKARIAAEYALFRTGPMSMAPSQLGAFARSRPDVATPDLEYHVQPLSLDRFGEPLHDFPAITASVCHLRPESRGVVRIATPDPAAPPVIQPNYLSTPGDRAVAADAIRLTRRILSQAPMARYQPQEFRPGPGAQDEEALIAAAGEIGTTIFHPVGTARMGTDERAVTDGRGLVRGVTGVRIVDASLMPRITSGNTNAPTIMMAEKIAGDILTAAH